MPKQHSVRPMYLTSFITIDRFCGTTLLAISLLALNCAQAQSTTFALGTGALVEGPAAGLDSVVLAATPATATWTAKANSTWLHISVANQSGIGSTNVVFSYDSNSGTIRSGSLTIGGQTLTVTQAGSTYVPVNTPITVVSGYSAGVMTIGRQGNIYFADVAANASGIYEWIAESNAVVGLFSSYGPLGVAVDDTSNVYATIPTEYTDVIEWDAADQSLNAVAGGMQFPQGLAIDNVGNIYVADTQNNAVKELVAPDFYNTTLVSSGLDRPSSVAVDRSGNVYIADGVNGAIKEWNPVNESVVALVPGNLYDPQSLGVDGAGNVYFSDTGNGLVKKWTAANHTVTTLVSRLVNPGVTADVAGNVYISDFSIFEIPHAFVDLVIRSYSADAGSNVLPTVLPTTENLLSPFTASDQTWLAITSVTNGVVQFTFSENIELPPRTAHLVVLGQTNTITQASPPPNWLAPTLLSSGVFQFAFSNFQNSSFTILSSTNLSVPLSDWMPIGTASNIAPNLFQFTDTNPPTDAQRFYITRSP